MNIRTKQFKAGHIKAISGRILEQTYTPEEWRLIADYNEATSVALTAFVSSRILACGGVRLDTNTMWVILDKDVANHKKELLYAAKLFMKILAPEHKTLNCQVFVGFKEGHRFVKHLGFKPLGTQTVIGFDDYERAA